jgi:uncharacterized damage-inducible protein DinB
MTATEILLLNFDETRRRSIKVWNAIPPEYYFWKPDKEAMPFLEMVRHILECQDIYHIIIKNGGELGNYVSPFAERAYTGIKDEIDFAEPFRKSFFETIKQFSSDDLTKKEIIRPEIGQRRKLGDYILRVAYHEAVHTGQLLSYLRTLGLERPVIWD